MDVGDILKEVGRNVNRNISAISANGGVDLVNAWQRDWATRWPYMPTLQTSATITVSANTRTYSLSASLDKIYDLTIPAESIHLQKVTMEQMNSFAPSASSITGQPTHYAPFGRRQVKLFPTPAAAYDIVYYMYENYIPVSATSNTPISIDAKYHDGAVWYTTWRMAQRMGDLDTMAIAKQEYDRVFDEAVKDMAARFAGANRVRVGGEYTSKGYDDRDKGTRMFFE
jgi:hypothetical protein